MSDDSQAKIAKLEQRVAECEMLILHHQRDFAALSDVVLEQAQAADQLRRQVNTFSERLKYWQTAAEQTAAEEPPPPHY